MFTQELRARQNADPLQAVQVVIVIGAALGIFLDGEIVSQPFQPLDDGRIWFRLISRQVMTGDDQACQSGTGHTASRAALGVAPSAVGLLSFVEMLLDALP